MVNQLTASKNAIRLVLVIYSVEKVFFLSFQFNFCSLKHHFVL